MRADASARPQKQGHQAGGREERSWKECEPRPEACHQDRLSEGSLHGSLEVARCTTANQQKIKPRRYAVPVSPDKWAVVETDS